MPTPDQLQQQVELYQSVIKVLEWLLGGVFTIVLTMIGVLHTGITKRLDKLDSHIDPVVRTLERHDAEIANIKDDVHDLREWQGVHNKAIQEIQRHPALRT